MASTRLLVLLTLRSLVTTFGAPTGQRELGATLLNCNFDDDMCSWANTGTLDWGRRSGSTPSGSTGPTGDHTTNGTDGSYVYIEASNPNFPSKGPFVLETALVTPGVGWVTFWYNMHGTGIGTLSLDTSSDGGSSWETTWGKSGNQGEGWWRAYVNVDSPLASLIRFSGVTGKDYTGDIAVDDVNVTRRLTPAPTVSPVPSLSPLPSPLPSPSPTPLPTTVLLTSAAQLQNAVARNVTVSLAARIFLTSDSIDVNNISGVFEILGNGHAIDGGGSTRCIYVNGAGTKLIAFNMSLVHGVGQEGGGVFVNGGAEVTLSECTVFGNAVEKHGGGCLVRGGSRLVLYSSRLLGNAAGFGGGGVKCEYSAVTMENSLVANNTATSGGGLLLQDCSSEIISSIFSLNEAFHDGGGVSMYVSTVIFSLSYVSDNVADFGGGINIDSTSRFNLIGSSVSSNVAEVGGGLYVAGSSSIVNLTDAEITSNAASGPGGGLFVASGEVSFDRATLRENSAIGGSFSKTSAGNCVVEGSCFMTSNFPEDYERNENCEFTALHDGTLSVLSFNTEEGYDQLTLNGVKYDGKIGPNCVEVAAGDTLEWNSDAELVSSGFKICYSVVASGGALFVGGGVVHLDNSSVTENGATSAGGGISINGGTIRMVESVVNNNSAVVGTAVDVISGIFSAESLRLSGSFSGPSAEGATCSSKCAAGSFGACSVPDGAPSCFTNCVCELCPAGKWSDQGMER